MAAVEPVLAVRDLVVDFDTPGGSVRAIDGVSFEVYPNEVLCIVGESGSGKSISLLAAIGLLPPAARVVSGEILFKGRDLGALPPAAMRGVRGKEIAMIFQDPMSALNPVIRVGRQIAEMVALHRPDMSRAAVKARAVELLAQMRVPDPERRYDAYPHEFSGGMRQRAMIAMAMAHHPALLIADEPTTALDVTIQAQVLDLLGDIRARNESSMILVTHDLGVVAETADRVVVMYSGRVMETGTVQQIFDDPRHPYTVGLLASLLTGGGSPGTLAYAIPGQPPTAAGRPSGCAFHPRCGLRHGRTACAEIVPREVQPAGSTHGTACLFADETPDWIRRVFPRVPTGEPA
jgi:oligopeptide/dipeptide ABC transporter ATP-binding protein